MNHSSVCSQSLTLDTRSSSPDHQAYYPHKPGTGTTTKGPPVKFPLIPQGSRRSPHTPDAADHEEQREEEEEGEEEEEEEGDEEEEGLGEESCCSTEGARGEAGVGGFSLKADRAEERSQRRRCKNPSRSPHDVQSKGDENTYLIDRRLIYMFHICNIKKRFLNILSCQIFVEIYYFKSIK